jgi:hypothetical protein
MALGDGDTWDETTPSNSTNLSDGDDHIRDVRKGVRVRMEYEHATFAASSAGGKHKFITLQAQGSKPTVDATQVAALYVKDVGAGVMELYYEDEAGNELQLTANGTVVGDGPAFHVTKGGTDQTGIVHNTLTKVTWSTEVYDTAGNFASNAFTPTVAGKYFLSASLHFKAGVDQTGYGIRLYKNGAYVEVQTVQCSGTGYVGLQISALVEANGSSDYFEIYVEQNSGSNQSIDGVVQLTSFRGFYVRS